MIKRSDALAFVEANLKNRNLVKHCLASEAVMRALARQFGEDEEAWGLAGLLHDADVETTPANLQGKTVGDMLAEKITPEMRYAMAAHNTQTGVTPKSRFDFALTSGETITGLIVASALVLPEKKLANLTKESIVKRFGEKRFAAGADRSLIMHCEKLDLTLDQFVDISLKAMQGIAGELGL
jgi:putative nucleotidyltransferase with HDIG domain